MPRWHVAPLVFRAPEAPAAGAGCCACPAGPGCCVYPRVFRAPEAPAAVCAGGRWPAREPPALRASLGASSRSPARPRHRPPAPRQIPPAPSTPVGPGVLMCACASARSPARPCLRPRVPQPDPVGQLGRLSETAIAFVGAGRALSETAIAFAGAGRALSETAVTFARSRSRGIETVIAFAGEKWAFLVQFSGAEVMPVSRLPCWRRAVVLSVSMSPRCRASRAKKLALRRCVIVKARKSSPCALTMAQNRRFLACWESFFAEMQLEGLCWANSFACAAREEARLGLVVSCYALSAADSSRVTSPCTLGG